MKSLERDSGAAIHAENWFRTGIPRWITSSHLRNLTHADREKRNTSPSVDPSRTLNTFCNESLRFFLLKKFDDLLKPGLLG